MERKPQTEKAEDSTRRHNIGTKIDSFEAQIAVAVFYFLLLAVIFFSCATSSNMLGILCQNMQRATTKHQTTVSNHREIE